ncbi:MAG TPA: type II toxin-antitoxin system prevent-host-death family antitoxin [Burkholderiales bacterium]|nr:type II toxin-antitoxin system prevent-host-death family antitoxin [Burkholderiales bacterium]
MLDQVAAGEQITITRHGAPVAVLAPVKSAQTRKEKDKVVAEIRRLRKGIRLGGLSIKELVVEGRKY